MAKLVTKMKDTTETFSRFEVYVNGKKQIGHILAFPHKDEKYGLWQVEGDPFKNQYPTSDKAAEALCAKNGRKLKIKEKPKK